TKVCRSSGRIHFPPGSEKQGATQRVDGCVWRTLLNGVDITLGGHQVLNSSRTSIYRFKMRHSPSFVQNDRRMMDYVRKFLRTFLNRNLSTSGSSRSNADSHVRYRLNGHMPCDCNFRYKVRATC